MECSAAQIVRRVMRHFEYMWKSYRRAGADFKDIDAVTRELPRSVRSPWLCAHTWHLRKHSACSSVHTAHVACTVAIAVALLDRSDRLASPCTFGTMNRFVSTGQVRND